ncbi:MAG: hypothetical protein U0736_13235 [Gemmataceae bacterium]
MLDLLRTWSNKRDRITIFPTAALLLEFNRPEDLSGAGPRPAGDAADRNMAGGGGERGADRVPPLPPRRYADYALPPERCVTVEPDGSDADGRPGAVRT